MRYFLKGRINRVEAALPLSTPSDRPVSAVRQTIHYTGLVIKDKKTGTVFRAGFCVFMYLHVKTPCAADLRLRTVKAVQISLTIHIDICCWNNSGSELRDVDCLRAFLTLDNIILYCFTLFERLESFLIDSAEVNEYIVTLGI